MTPVNYLIAVTTSQHSVENTLAILNIAGRGHAIHGFSNGEVSTDLWIIPKGKGCRQEVLNQLQAIPAICSVSVVALSHPVQETELIEIRQLFAGLGWDGSNISDGLLSDFMNAKLKGQHNFYIDYNPREKPPIKIQIKPIEKHPHFKHDWLKTSIGIVDEQSDRELTVDDIKIHSMVIEEVVEAPQPPPPPKKKE